MATAVEVCEEVFAVVVVVFLVVLGLAGVASTETLKKNRTPMRVSGRAEIVKRMMCLKESELWSKGQAV